MRAARSDIIVAMPSLAKRGLAVMAAVVLSLSCSRSAPVRNARRVGVPPDMLRVLEDGPDAGMGPIQFVALRPYDRARDLEVLLFASGSPVFSGIVLPGRWVPLVSAWAEPFPSKGFAKVRPDVIESLKSDKELLALPITLDGGLLVYRADLWDEHRLPAPRSLAALREAVLHLGARRPELSKPIVSDVPADQLFWDLAWSYEGQASPELYSYPKLHALGFIKEFGLAQGQGPEPSGEQLLLQGRSAALFCMALEARKLLAPGAPLGGKLRVARIPSMQASGHCIYAGWCLARPAGSDLGTGNWAGMCGERYQRCLKEHGCEPVLEDGKEGGDGVSRAFASTQFHAPPDLGEGGDEIVLGAILDATQGSMDAEEALRRAEARVRRKAG
jgi:hypothetical protein